MRLRGVVVLECTCQVFTCLKECLRSVWKLQELQEPQEAADGSEKARAKTFDLTAAQHRSFGNVSRKVCSRLSIEPTMVSIG